MITIRRVSLGAGYKYLMESVAGGDGASHLSNNLTRYYAESGTPPGVFLGAGLAALDGGKGVAAGSEVTEEHLWNMLGNCADPITGEVLGARRPNRQPPTLGERIGRRVAALPADLGEPERSERRARLEAEERAKTCKLKAPVAGFDLTFSPTKSVSAAWAVADQGTKAIIYECHRRAIAYTLAYAEQTIFHSRSGTNGVVQEDIEGVVAASFTHWDSRAGDPQLHDHVVVLNRAKSTSDGNWRTLDSRGLFKSVVTLSELHQGVLADMLTEAMGFAWDGHHTRAGMAKWEIEGVSETLMAEFSQRRDAIESHRDGLIEQFVAAQGRQPTTLEKVRLNQQANLATRQAKQHQSLAALSGEWRQRAVAHVGTDPIGWVSTLKDRNDLPLLRADDFAEPILADAAGLAALAVAGKRSTFSRANVVAEVHRQFHGVRFASPDERVAVVERTADITLSGSLVVTAPDLHHTPERFRRADGTSRFRATDHKLFTHQSVLDAEGRLLAAGQEMTGPTVPVGIVAAIAECELAGREHGLSVDQAVAVEQIATSGRSLDVLVGPAGTGKTTTMAGLRAAWESEHGSGSVLGLAPSASAAEVLARELGISTENTAKWLHECRQTASRRGKLANLRGRIANLPAGSSAIASLAAEITRIEADIERWQFQPRQLVIVDEASLTGTFALDELVTAADQAGAKVLLVGDWAQLSGVEAGGMFRALVRDREGLAPELTDVRRFASAWEKAASVELRLGREVAIHSYQAHDRIKSGDRDEMLATAYRAWKADEADGKRSLMIAADLATVMDLNARVRAGRIAGGEVSEAGLAVAGGATAGVGDRVVTRKNERLLTTGRAWVKNGDQWIVTASNDDGSMTVKRAGGASELVLPADYVAAHVELGYASTAHRAQGRTVDTAHAMVSPTTAREVLYVAATRGRESNQLYVDTGYDPDPQTSHDGTSEPQTAREVLVSVLANEGADVAAHDTIRRSHEEMEGLVRLSAEYLTIAKEAQADRWEALLERSGLTDAELDQVRASDAHGPLVAAFREAEARGLDIETNFPNLAQARTLANVADPASALHGRVDRWTEAAGSKRRAADNLIAGLIPRARGVTNPDMLRALEERDRAMEQRARTLAETAVAKRAPWIRQLGTPPADPLRREAWMADVATVAAYRERWSWDGKSLIAGKESIHSIEQIGHHKQAQAAIDRALRITRADKEATPGAGAEVTVAPQPVGPDL
ncbi:MAG: MobF family relaxase [Acidimicrobiales bacterium]